MAEVVKGSAVVLEEEMGDGREQVGGKGGEEEEEDSL